MDPNGIKPVGFLGLFKIVDNICLIPKYSIKLGAAH
jgi:hypothetical protein